jgi:hypothetical protein
MITPGMNAQDLALWQECASLGACIQTVQMVSGMTAHHVRELVFGGEIPVHTGRPPYRHPMEVKKPLMHLQLSAFGSAYRPARDSGVDALRALINAYRRIEAVFADTAFRFDTGFVTVSHLEGIWLSDRPSLRWHCCRNCGAPVLTFRIDSGEPPCAACELRASARHSPRLGWTLSPAPPPRRPRPWPPAPPRRTCLNLLAAELRSYTKHARVVAQILYASPYRDLMHNEQLRQVTATSLRPLTIERMQGNLSTVHHVQYSLALILYDRWREAGLEPHLAVLRAYDSLVGSFNFLSALPFERVFDFVRMFDGEVWSSPTRIVLHTCQACECRFAVSLVDRDPPRCPFCRVTRRPNQYLKHRWAPPPAAGDNSNIEQVRPSRATFIG